ncbi:MerR family transcriptional regulator [Rhodobacteraceae bacterium]|nr:MerR family transcriptional regulator [Paracoccaceae bacterium]
MAKSAAAFRTISETSEAVGVPTHVLRFWESKFAQIKPTKRAGNRRYYRPADVTLLCGIRKLLHEDGITIRGVQKILREKGVKHVMGLTDDSSTDAAGIEPPAEQTAPIPADDAQIPQARATVPLAQPAGGGFQPSLLAMPDTAQTALPSVPVTLPDFADLEMEEASVDPPASDADPDAHSFEEVWRQTTIFGQVEEEDSDIDLLDTDEDDGTAEDLTPDAVPDVEPSAPASDAQTTQDTAPASEIPPQDQQDAKGLPPRQAIQDGPEDGSPAPSADGEATMPRPARIAQRLALISPQSLDRFERIALQHAADRLHALRRKLDRRP